MRRGCSRQLSLELQHRGHDVGVLWSTVLGRHFAGRALCAGHGSDRQSHSSTIKPSLKSSTNKTLTFATTPTPATTRASSPALRTCKSYNNCLSCVNASIANTICFWIECKEDKSYCSPNSRISDCHVVNGTELCSAPTSFLLPTICTGKITTTLPSSTTASPTGRTSSTTNTTVTPTS
ncbi:sialomucin core protein 24-like [Dasypus novemcinctus]|uniref:sialomucin core protein 24-like n=1 Tax=Dasypus novemcinctus TaxID=9361 RepID=UPI00062AB6B1|nr:sialomucin core protein 24-like [Dasypus novemcinctus]